MSIVLPSHTDANPSRRDPLRGQQSSLASFESNEIILLKRLPPPRHQRHKPRNLAPRPIQNLLRRTRRHSDQSTLVASRHLQSLLRQQPPHELHKFVGVHMAYLQRIQLWHVVGDVTFDSVFLGSDFGWDVEFNASG